MAKDTGGATQKTDAPWHWHKIDKTVIRAIAAIALKIPDSGIDWLDKMIAKAERRDIAAGVMQAMGELLTKTEDGYCPGFVVRDAYTYADTVIAEGAKGE